MFPVERGTQSVGNPWFAILSAWNSRDAQRRAQVMEVQAHAARRQIDYTYHAQEMEDQHRRNLEVLNHKDTLSRAQMDAQHTHERARWEASQAHELTMGKMKGKQARKADERKIALEREKGHQTRTTMRAEVKAQSTLMETAARFAPAHPAPVGYTPTVGPASAPAAAPEPSTVRPAASPFSHPEGAVPPQEKPLSPGRRRK